MAEGPVSDETKLVMRARWWTCFGDSLWDVSFQTLAYYLTRDPVFVVWGTILKCFLISTSPAVFPRLFHRRELRWTYTRVVCVQIGCVLTATILASASGTTGGECLWAAITVAAIAYYLGLFLENRVQARLTLMLSVGQDDQRRISRLLSVQSSKAAAVAYAFAAGVFFAVEVLPFALATAGVVAIVVVAAANIATFATELILVRRAMGQLAATPDDGRGNEPATQPIVVSRFLGLGDVPRQAWLGIASAGFVWVTILYPSPVIITAVAAESMDIFGEAAWGPAVALITGTLLSSLAFRVYAFGGDSARKSSARYMSGATVKQGAALAAAVCLLMMGGIAGVILFFALLVASRYFLGYAYTTYEAFITGTAQAAGRGDVTRQKHVHEQSRSWGIFIHYLLHSGAFLAFDQLLAARPPGSSPSALTIAGAVSAGFVLAGGVAWWAVERARARPVTAAGVPDGSAGQPEERP